MTAKLTILLAGDVLSALGSSKSVTIAVGPQGDRGDRPIALRSGGTGEPTAGTLPARVLGWAKDHSKSFGTADVTRKFKLSRAHASMVLSRLASGPFAIQREKRGLYRYGR